MSGCTELPAAVNVRVQSLNPELTWTRVSGSREDAATVLQTDGAEPGRL